MGDAVNPYPFRCVLSFGPLIRSLRSSFQENRGSDDFGEPRLDRILEEAPELAEPIEDLSLLKRRGPWVERLMALAFPPSYWEKELLAAVVPYVMRPVLVSPVFRALFLNSDGAFAGRPNLSDSDFARGRAIRAYLLILEKLYGITRGIGFPLVYVVTDPETGLERHFKMNLDFRFVEVLRTDGGEETPDPGDREYLLANLGEPELLRQRFPPEAYTLQGFTMYQAVDVTETEVLSALERTLVDRESVVSRNGFMELQGRLRTLFRRPDLLAGLAAIQDDQVLLLTTGSEMKRRCIFRDSHHIPIHEFKGTPYERAVTEGKVIHFPDVLSEPWPDHMMQDIRDRGVRSLIVAPLFFKGECIGTLDLATLEPGGLGAMETLIAEQIQPIFAMAIRRSLDDLQTRVEGVIKQECTAIHPSVEWRFRRAALRAIERAGEEGIPEMEPIVFSNVHPFYATSDIRGSTDVRNEAVQNDLAEHLDLALDVIRKAFGERPLLIFREMEGRVRDMRDRIESHMDGGDEITILAFLQGEVAPVFEHLSGFSPDVARAIEACVNAVDAKVGTVYRLRKAFEESVTRLNDRLAAFLDREEEDAQAMFPHYFERHRTDGVDYVIYMGESLAEGRVFHDLYLKNMHLWQLRVACGMAWQTERLKASLKVPLDTAHIILVQHAPLSIRFRYDEKRFDVDGAYDVRHEILKSRIDKAVIKGTGERLTQPGRVAVVYSHPDEARDMRRHIHFLSEEGFLTGTIEDLELGDLPGVQGLKALRVAVDLASPALAEAAGKGLDWGG